MKYYCFFLLLIFINFFSIAEEVNPIVGIWELTERAYKDYDGNLVYDNYKAYIKLKGDIYKSSYSPKIDSYTEKTILTFNEDNTGSFEVIETVNGEKAVFDHENKVWEYTDSKNDIHIFKYTLNKNVYEIIYDNKIYKIIFNVINEKDENLLILSSEDILNIFSGKYIRSFDGGLL